MQPCVAQFLIKYHTLCTLRQLCTLHDHLKLRLDNAGRIACPRIEAPFFNELTRVCRLFSEAGFVGPRQTAPFARIDQQRTCRVPVALRHVATHILETMRAIRRMGHEKCLGTRPSAQMKRHRRKWVTCSHTQHCFACGSKQR
uniref:Secreted protein n=1 Tax=Ascaris lumbricoides TaxID=6252 RepID=A0A0M3HF24_ASCLU